MNRQHPVATTSASVAKNHVDNRFRNQDQFVIGSTQSNNSLWGRVVEGVVVRLHPATTKSRSGYRTTPQRSIVSKKRLQESCRPSPITAGKYRPLVPRLVEPRHPPAGFPLCAYALNQDSKSGSRRSNGTSMDENPCSTQHRSGASCRTKVDTSQCSRTTGSPSNRCQRNCRPDQIDK